MMNEDRARVTIRSDSHAIVLEGWALGAVVLLVLLGMLGGASWIGWKLRGLCEPGA